MDVAYEDDRLNDLIDMLAGHAGLAPAIVAAVVVNHGEFWTTQDRLVAALDGGSITPQSYLEEFNRALETMYAKDKSVMGAELFDRVFGEEADHASEMIDPDIFFSEHAKQANYG